MEGLLRIIKVKVFFSLFAPVLKASKLIFDTFPNSLCKDIVINAGFTLHPLIIEFDYLLLLKESNSS